MSSTAENEHRLIFISTKLERCANSASSLLSNFQIHRQHIKVIPAVAYVTSARRPAALRTRYTNRLNPENNGGVRNVPLPHAALAVSLFLGRLSPVPSNDRPTDRPTASHCQHRAGIMTPHANQPTLRPSSDIIDLQACATDPMQEGQRPCIQQCILPVINVYD